MSATTLNLPYTRFVAQVSTAPARSKSTYLALMEENLAALQKCPWKEAADVPAALADHDFTASTHLSSAYDAFKMTGNYSASTMTEIAYAGMAAYRFKIPDSASAVALSSISIPVSRDRYLKSGVRVVAVLSDSATPSADWDVVRGSGGILLSAQLPQTAAYLLAGAPGKDTLELAASSFAGLAETGHAYLWIYLTLEDYTEHWDMYSANEQRLYAVEGSAMLVGGSAEFTFAGEVTADAAPSTATLLAGGASPTWIQPLPTRNAGNTKPINGDMPPENLFFRQSADSATTLNSLIFLKFPVYNTQEASGPDSYTGMLRVNAWAPDKDGSAAGVTQIRFTLDYGSNPDPTQWSQLSPVAGSNGVDTNGYRCWEYTYTYHGTARNDPTGNPTVVGDMSYDRTIQIWLKTAVQAEEVNGATTSELLIRDFTYYLHTYVEPYPTAAGSPNEYTSIHTIAPVSPTTFMSSTRETFYLWLQFLKGSPVAADKCASQDVSARQNKESSITTVTANGAWTVVVDSLTYSVTRSSTTVSVAISAGGGSTPLGTQQLTSADGTAQYFDEAVTIWKDNASLRDYGVAATLGDFSHAVVAFEAGLQPSDAEMLGRLARNSRNFIGEMLYLHPVSGALAGELDTLRPVPRFFRAATDPTGQTACQPGLSIWYKRPARTATIDDVVTPIGGSTWTKGIVYKGGAAISTAVVNYPVFLQYTLLAVRAPAAGEGMSLVMQNVGSSPVVNGFDLRFAVWRSPAEEWDGSNNFALSAIVAAPCLYRADGADDVSWMVDCGGSAFPFGTRTVHARRLGISPVVSGSIAANQEIAVPLSGALEEGDVLIIAPVVLGFADGVGAGSVYFGRQSDPSNATTGWARYDTDLGWFPQITLEP